LILVTEGFTVYAIAKIIEIPKPITSNEYFKQFCGEFEIDYLDFVIYSKAEWFELSKLTFLIMNCNKESVESENKKFVSVH